jgi:predicted enzyme related to lactoylglutathione lyase
LTAAKQQKGVKDHIMKSINLNVLFVVGFGPIVQDSAESNKFYRDALGLSFKKDGEYLHTEELKGVNTFALWPLSQAAQSCFGSETWPSNIPTPQAWLEFDVDNLEQATTELEARGYKLMVKMREEPWGQVVTRLLSPEGLLIGITLTPSMREKKK